MSAKVIEAFVEISIFEENPPWRTAPLPNSSFLKLFSGVTDEEIGSVMMTACSYNHIEISASADETLSAFAAKNFVLPGGLRFLENEQVKIVPGCCAGLEDWRDWLDAPSGGRLWAGHDPSPGVEFVDDFIRIWQDEKADNVSFIDLEIDEMHQLLKKVESELNDFIFRLGQWCDWVSPALKEKIVRHFADNMHI